MKLWWYFSGLHTCGNLAPASLRIFLANPTMKLCCNVGCCYHLLDEEFYTNPYQVDDQDVKTPNFPLSSILRERQFWLGRNARMVAAQPMDRAINNQQVKKMRAKRAIFVWFLCSNSFFFHSSSYAIIWRKKHSELPFPNARIYLRKHTVRKSRIVSNKSIFRKKIQNLNW